MQGFKVNVLKKNHNLERYMHANVHRSIIYNSQNMDAAFMSTDRKLDKENVVCVYIYTHIHTYICVYIHTHTYIPIYVYIYIHTHTYAHTDNVMLLIHKNS